MITRKSLITTLNAMNLNAVLCPSTYRTTNDRAGAARRALGQFVKVAFGQRYHSTKNGDRQIENPRWFKQLFTDLEWSTGDITAGSILYALCAK